MKDFKRPLKSFQKVAKMPWPLKDLQKYFSGLFKGHLKAFQKPHVARPDARGGGRDVVKCNPEFRSCPIFSKGRFSLNNERKNA